MLFVHAEHVPYHFTVGIGRLLMRPHHFIFNRDWYEKQGGRDQFTQYKREFRKLSPSERTELLGLIAAVDPSDLKDQVGLATTPRVRSIMEHYLPLSKEKEAEIWAKQRAMKKKEDPSIVVPDEERVEDAGLNYEETPAPSKPMKRKKAMATA
jgi:hypothetical protein